MVMRLLYTIIVLSFIYTYDQKDRDRRRIDFKLESIVIIIIHLYCVIMVEEAAPVDEIFPCIFSTFESQKCWRGHCSTMSLTSPEGRHFGLRKDLLVFKFQNQTPKLTTTTTTTSSTRATSNTRFLRRTQ
jgi:hypothetical protein